MERVFQPVAVHFKGSGFYNTDYGTRKRSREMKEAEGERQERRVLQGLQGRRRLQLLGLGLGKSDWAPRSPRQGLGSRLSGARD